MQRLSGPNPDAERLDIGQGWPTDLPHPGSLWRLTRLSPNLLISVRRSGERQRSGLDPPNNVLIEAPQARGQSQSCPKQYARRLQHPVPADSRATLFDVVAIRQRVVASHSRSSQVFQMLAAQHAETHRVSRRTATRSGVALTGVVRIGDHQSSSSHCGRERVC